MTNDEPKDLIDLTKTLAENCKVDAKRHEGPATKKNEPFHDRGAQSQALGGVVDGLEEIVRQLYGTNLQSGETVVSPAPPPVTEPVSITS